MVKREKDPAQSVATQARKGTPAKQYAVTDAHSLKSPHVLEEIGLQKFQEPADALRMGTTVPADALWWQADMHVESSGGGLYQ